LASLRDFGQRGWRAAVGFAQKNLFQELLQAWHDLGKNSKILSATQRKLR
jgi:hypothetical protein